jgi:2,5-dioxopentanoate dehydrogenase
MNLHGKQFIGFSNSSESINPFQALNPTTGEKLPTTFSEASEKELNQAVDKAATAFQSYRSKSGVQRAEFLEAIANEILALGDALIDRCTAETGLPVARITGERGRTTGQLNLFAQMLREGSWVQASIDLAQPTREPLPKPDIRSMQLAIGPVAVFGASNFPLAFSVAGGDTVSALAAGCPVVVKAHPAHPGTCELIATAIVAAAQKTNMPEGVFSMIHGGAAIGVGLVNHPSIKAVGFTGSYTVGKILFDAAAKREEPIPVYSEMGSVNPVFILPEALEKNGDSIAQGYTNAVNMGVGQFCTNPGMLLIEKAPQSEPFLNLVKAAFEATTGGTMLTEGIQNAYNKGVDLLKTVKESVVLAEGKPSETYTGVAPVVFKVAAKDLNVNHALSEEVFGPTSVIVEANSKTELIEVAQKLKGHLTATLWGTPKDLIDNQDLIKILEQKVGRVIINGFPTGVEVCHSMVHGGPFPSTTNAASTSVGTNAIYRFTRAVCYQGFTDEILPDELKQSNPLKIFRKIDGKYGTN